MTKVRILLSLLMAAIATGIYYSYVASGHATYRLLHGRYVYVNWPLGAIAANIVLSVLFAAVALVLLSTFFQVHRDATGRYYYDRRNFWWRLMSRFWWLDWEDRISLCKAFWLTVVFEGIVLFLLAVATLGAVVVVWVVCNVHRLAYVSSGDLRLLVTVLAACAGLLGFFYFLSWLSDTSKAGEYVVKAVVAAILATIFVVMPIAALATGRDHLPLLLAILMYLRVVAAFVGLPVAAIWAGHKYIFKNIPTLVSRIFKDTAIGQYLVAMKQGLCPLLEARNGEAS